MRITLVFTTCLLLASQSAQCGANDVRSVRNPITATRILRIHEIEAPATVRVAASNFEITLKNTSDPSNHHLENTIKCDDTFFWDANKKDNQLELAAKVSYIANATEGCGGFYNFRGDLYQIPGPFSVGDFTIRVLQPDATTLTKQVQIVE